MAEGVSKETQLSLAASSMFPGFRFSPTDVELISYYLKKKLDGADKFVEVISEVEICRFEPWDLPAKSIIKSENEWFFFCARGRKYPNGSQSRRATELGYWKATGKERNVKSGSTVIGTKRTLVFHVGRAPKGERTEWIMHEYCMDGKSQDSLVICRLRKNSEFRLNNNGRQPSTIHDSNHAASDGVVELAGSFEGDKGVESCSKKCSSSYDSHSIEQNDSASDFTPTESCSQQKDTDDEDDFFADILKDDIIKLDETTLSGQPNHHHLPVIPETPPQHKPQELPSQFLPFQGTANRRIRLRKITESSSENKETSKCLVTVFTGKKTVKFRLIYITFITVTLLTLLVSFLGISKPVNNFQYSTTSYKDL